jgi:hypothetical protein
MLNPPIRKIVDPTEYFANINIPDDWNSIEEFVDWYIDARMPLMVPWNAHVIRSDDATAMCVFKKGHYQVELYLEFPKMYIQRHSHPRMEVIVVDFGGGHINPAGEHPMGTAKSWGKVFENVKDGNEHGGDTISSFSNGSCFLACQRWENIDEMTSAAIQWKGTTAGPLQEELIRKAFANRNLEVKVESGYADVSEPKQLNKREA